MIQESKLPKVGMIKLKVNLVFKKIRKDTYGGGLMTAVGTNHDPIVVYCYDNIEMLTVEVTISSKKAKTIISYGPQE